MTHACTTGLALSLALFSARISESQTTPERSQPAASVPPGYGEIYDYIGRLMRALGNPKTVFPTHLDAYGDPAAQPRIAEARRVFADEIRRVSPKTSVILPVWFQPIVLGSAR